VAEAQIRFGEARDEDRLVALFYREYGTDTNWQRDLDKITADPTYRPHRWALVEVDGEIVSAGLLMPRRVKIGDATLRAGLVGYMVTVTEHRRKGYGSQVMRGLEGLLEKEEFDYGYLSASPVGLLLYSYLGWQIFLDDVFVELPMEEAATLAPRDKEYQILPVSETSTDDLWELYDFYARRTPGAILRTPEEFGWLIDFKLHRQHIHRELSLAAMQGNRLCGYVIGRQGNFHVPEEGLYTVTESVHRVGELDAYGAMLPVLCEKAAQMGFQTLRLGLHSQHPLMVWANRKRARRAYDPLHDMALITNLGRFITQMSPELHNRLTDSHWNNARTSLAVSTEHRSVAVAVEDNVARELGPGLNVEHSVTLREEDVVPWLLGHISITALAQTGQVTASSQMALDLANAMFPRIELWQSHLDC